MRYHISANFQCDLCHFRNMKGRDPTNGSNKDEISIIAIRRASLDAFLAYKQGSKGGFEHAEEGGING